MEPYKGNSGNWRLDIQVLRGLAVLLVVGFHAFPATLKKGYLGVDIFFVISGFLVTNAILSDHRDGKLNLGQFYARRFWRLVPAAMVVLAVTTLAARFLLLPEKWPAFSAQVFGALTFSANIILPQQLGYFDPAAFGKPLLHIWSLSLEEQFYFVLPLVIIVTSPKSIMPRLIALAGVSFSLCFLLTTLERGDANLAFYSLTTRAWELLAGSIAASFMLNHPELRVPALLKRSVLAAVLCVCFVGVDEVHPRFDSLAVVSGTLLLLIGNDGWMKGFAPARLLSKIGDCSYSLYLIHWPLLSFLSLAYLGAPPALAVIAACLLSLALAWLQYIHIEQRFRSLWRIDWRRTLTVAALPAVAAVLSGYASALPAPAREPEPGLHPSCAQRGRSYLPLDACRTSAQPKVALWGDSYAMHLVPGLLADESLAGSLLQVTKHACAPILGVAQIDALGEAWSRKCIAYNRSAFAKLASTPSLKVVVVASPFSILAHRGQIIVNGVRKPHEGEALAELRATLEALQRMGKEVVVVGPTPVGSFDPRLCVLRRAKGLPVLGRDECQVTDIQPKIIEVSNAMRGMRDRYPVILAQDLFCDSDSCVTQIGGKPLYRDAGHFSNFGSEVFIRRTLAAELKRRLAS